MKEHLVFYILLGLIIIAQSQEPLGFKRICQSNFLCGRTNEEVEGSGIMPAPFIEENFTFVLRNMSLADFFKDLIDLIGPGL